MQLSQDGVTYGLVLWPSAVALLGAALSTLCRALAPTPTPPPPLEDDGYRLEPRPRPRSHLPVPRWALLLHGCAVVAMLKPLGLAGLGRWLKVSHFTVADRFFPVLLLDGVLLWLSGHLLCALAARGRGAQGLLGFALSTTALIHLWATDHLGPVPLLGEHSCQTIQEGRRCALRIPHGEGWEASLSALQLPSRGTSSVPVRLRRWPGQLEGQLAVTVGEDRGHPLFAPRVGDRWFYLNDNHDPKRLGYRDARELGPVIGTTTMAAVLEEEHAGVRFLLLQLERQHGGETQQWSQWLYFLDGGTFTVDDEHGKPHWLGFGKDVVRELDEDGALREPLGSYPRGKPMMNPFKLDSPLDAVTVPCYFLLVPGACRCQRGPLPGDKLRQLPGPVACRASANFGKVALSLLTFFAFRERTAVLTLHESLPSKR